MNAFEEHQEELEKYEQRKVESRRVQEFKSGRV